MTGLGKYAEALYAEAVKSKQVEEIASELQALKEVMNGSEQFYRMVIRSPLPTRTEKAAGVRRALQGHFSKTLVDFVGMSKMRLLARVCTEWMCD